MLEMGYDALEVWMEKARELFPSIPSASDWKWFTDLPKFFVGLDELKKASTDSCNDNIVVFLGQTKAGKSTLINCLLDLPLVKVYDPNTGDVLIVNQNEGGLNGPTISSESDSETTIPQKYNCRTRLECEQGIECTPGLAYTLWDMPGFDDNRGTFQEILNAVMFKNVIMRQNSVRFVFVVDFALLKERNNLPLFKLLCKFTEICPITENNVCLVVTRNDRGDVRKRLDEIASKESSGNMNATNRNIAMKGKTLIRELLDNEAFIDFQQPTKPKNSKKENFKMPNKLQVIDCLNKLSGIKIKYIPLVLSDAAKMELSYIHSTLYEIINDEIDKTCLFIDYYGNSLPDNLVFYKTAQTIVDCLLNINDLTGLVTGVADKLESRDSKGLNSLLNAFTIIDDLHESIFKSQKSTGRRAFEMKVRDALLKLSGKLNERIMGTSMGQKTKNDEETKARQEARNKKSKNYEKARQKARDDYNKGAKNDEDAKQEEARGKGTKNDEKARQEEARDKGTKNDEKAKQEEARDDGTKSDEEAGREDPKSNFFLRAIKYVLKWLGWL